MNQQKKLFFLNKWYSVKFTFHILDGTSAEFLGSYIITGENDSCQSCLNNTTKPIMCTIFMGGVKKRDFVWISESFLCKFRLKAFFPILCGVGDKLLHIMIENVALPNMYFWNFVKCQWERWTNVICCKQSEITVCLSVIMYTIVLQYKKIEESHVLKFKVRSKIR